MVALRRKRTHRNADKNGHYRWYDDYQLPDRDLDDTLYLRRAHSVGAARQHLNLLGYALVVNAVAVHRYARRRAPDTRAA